jgi:polar amino acid transport system permease protein
VTEGLILHGVKITVLAATLGGLVMIPCAVAGGLGRLSPLGPVRLAAGAYIEFFRGTSAIVQLFWAFFVLPGLGITLSPLTVGILVLGMNTGAYGAEIVRGAVRAVPRGQWEAATALRMGPFTRMLRVVLPQAVPTMIPPFGNLLIDLLKATSLLSLVTVADATTVINNLGVSGTLQFQQGYPLLLGIYFVLSLPVVALTRSAEWRARRHLPKIRR